MNNNYPKRTLFLSILFLAFSCFAFWFLYSEINRNNEIIKESLTIWNAEDARRKEIRLLNQSIQKIEEKKALLEMHFAQSSNAVPFLDTIESLAKSVGAEIEISSVEVSSSEKELLLQAKVRGSFEEIYKFILLAENSPYKIELSSVSIQKSSAEGSAGWDASFKIRLLSFMK